MALRSTLLVLLLAIAGPLACKERSRATFEVEGAAALAPSAALSPWPCVPFERLRRHLPSALEGMQRVRDEGSSGRYGEVSISEAERVFMGAGGSELTVRIVDTTMVGQLGHAIRAAADEASTRPPEDPTSAIELERAIGFVRFDPNEGRAEASLLVADRFVVAVTGRGHEDATLVRRVAEGIDVDGLALLR